MAFKNIFDTSGILSVGYDYSNLLMAEHYNAHGSPYWGLKAYIFLMLSDDHEFWSCDIEEMPKLDELKLIKEADMLVSRRNGKSVAYPAGTITDFACGQIVPKYLKFAYSAHFGFNVMRSNISIDEAACDSMLTFVVDGAVLVRRHLKSYNVENDRVVIEWSPFKGFDVKTVITPTTFGHTRSHEINSEYDCVAYDAGFAVASRDKDNIKTKDSFIAQARNDFQFCEVLTETGGEGCIIESSPNTNIRYSKTVIPAMKYEIHKGKNEIKTLIRDHLEG